MTRCAKRALCFVLSILLLLSPLTAFAFDYPDGIDPSCAQSAISSTDTLAVNAVPALTGKTLSELLGGAVYTDEVLSSFVIMLYTSLADYSAALRLLGIDVSPASVASGLDSSPQVKDVLANSVDWNSVRLDGVSWGVNGDATAFANCFGAALRPLAPILSLLMCEGEMTVLNVTLKGGRGYETVVRPLLIELGCPHAPGYEEYRSLAEQNPDTMAANLVLSVFSLIDLAAVQPAAVLCRALPVLAAYLTDGSLDSLAQELIEPLSTKISLFGIADIKGPGLDSLLSFMSAPDAAFNADTVTDSLMSLAGEHGLTLERPDFGALAAVRGDSSAAYVMIMLYLIKTLRNNRQTLLTSAVSGGDPGMAGGVIDRLFAMSDDKLLAQLVGLFTADSGTALEHQWTAAPFTAETVSFTGNLGREQLDRVVDGMDDLISGIIAENGSYGSLSELLGARIYSDSTLTALINAVGDMLSQDGGGQSAADAAPLLRMLGIPATADEFGAYLINSGYVTAGRTISSYGFSAQTIYWGIIPGSRDSFRTALSTVLMPFRGVLEALLANSTIDIFGAIHIGGTNGYNTAVIPLFEALGIPDAAIKTYSEYVAGKGTSLIVTDVVDPVLALIDIVIESPVYTALGILPNALRFISTGGLKQCIDNLISPFSAMADEYGFDLSAITELTGKLDGLDVNSVVKELLASSETDITLPDVDLNRLSGMGTLVYRNSRRTYNAQPVTFDYVEADRAAEMMAVLRVLASILQDPRNSSITDAFMNSGEDGNQMFSSFGGEIGAQMSEMSQDELIEWLYKLFFRERATSDATDQAYIPTIIYTAPKKKADLTEPLIAVTIVLIVAVIVLYSNRGTLGDMIEKRRDKRAAASPDTRYKKRKRKKQAEPVYHTTNPRATGRDRNANG
ncbi:MAG: hypothetical protein K6C36_03540 [Clostridia bacterium]|nr:hypothetical protein [Clostridia bacterium]